MNDVRDEERRLREVLQAAAPEGPGATGRTEALVTRRRRERQRRVGAVGAAAMVVAAVAVGTTLVGGSGGTQPSAGDDAAHRHEHRMLTSQGPHDGPHLRSSLSTPSTRTFVNGRDRRTSGSAALGSCGAAVQVSVKTSSTHVPVRLTSDARAIRVCPAALPGQQPRTDLTGEPVTLGVSRVFSRLRYEPTASPHRCDAVRALADPYVVTWVDASGGEHQGVVMSSCDDVYVDGRPVASDDFLKAYEGAADGKPRSPFNGPGAGPLSVATN